MDKPHRILCVTAPEERAAAVETLLRQAGCRTPCVCVCDGAGLVRAASQAWDCVVRLDTASLTAQEVAAAFAAAPFPPPFITLYAAPAVRPGVMAVPDGDPAALAAALQACFAPGRRQATAPPPADTPPADMPALPRDAYRALVQNVRNIILLVRRDGTIAYINHYGASFFGYASAALLGRHIVGTIVPEKERGGRDMAALIRRVLEQPEAYSTNENENMRSDGSRVWVAWSNTVVHEAGESRLLSVGTDITARRRVEEELHKAKEALEERVALRSRELEESERQLRQVIEFMPKEYFFYARTPEGAVTYLSPGAKHVLGVQEKDCARVLASCLPASGPKGGAVSGTPLECRLDAGGEVRFLEVQEGAMVEEKGLVLHLVGVAHDITGRKRIEEQLKHAVEELEAIFDNSMVGIGFTRDGRFIKINRRGAMMLGYEPEELIGDDGALLFHDRGVFDSFEARFHESLATRGHFHADQLLRRKDGSTSWCRLYARALDPRAPGKGVIWAVDDINEQKRLESELRLSIMAAEAANRAKSEFLANMSHELRTPIGGILGMTELTLASGPNEDQERYLALIRDSATSLLHIINDVLDLSKIEAGKLPLQPVVFDAAVTLGSAVRQMEALAVAKGLALSWSEPAQAVPRLLGDPERLSQIVRNLVGNGIKFTEAGGVSVAMEIRHVSLQNAELRVAVTDTGPGIPAQDQGRLFQSFSQLDSSYAKKFKGTGLGLAISKELVEMMGGRIWVESEPGKGSTFFFMVVLPQAGVDLAQARASRPSDEEAPRALRVLLAEDNVVAQEFLSHFVERVGHSVEIAADGFAALEAYASKKYDIVFMDVQMPGMDGIETTHRIRALEQERHLPRTPVVALTAYAMKGDKERFLREGMDGFISKPVDLKVVYDVLHQIAGGSASSGRLNAPPARPRPCGDMCGSVDRPEGEDAVLQRLYKKFLTVVVPSFLERVSVALLGGDLHDVGEAGHQLKGAAATIGLDEIFAMALDLEQAAQNGDIRAAETVFARIGKAFGGLPGGKAARG